MTPVGIHGFAEYFGALAPGRDAAVSKLRALIQKHDSNAVITKRPSGPELPTARLFPGYHKKLTFGFADVCRVLGVSDGHKMTLRPIPFDSIKDVPVDELLATQPVVKANKIQTILDTPPVLWSKQDVPLFAYKDNKYYIFDGHHRVAAAILLGMSTVSGQVVDLTV